LMVFAPPAAIAPPNNTATTSATDGQTGLYL